VINWGDDETTVVNPGNTEYLHTYENPGTYEVFISNSENITYILFSTGNNSLTEFLSFGSAPLDNLNLTFSSALNLTYVPTSIPLTVTSLISTFAGATDFNSSNVTTWNTSNVTNMTVCSVVLYYLIKK